MQRLRISFDRGEELKFLSHLDLLRLWERAFRRAKIELTYSEGFTPHPKISVAAPLSVGVTSKAELMDIFLSEWLSPSSFNDHIKVQLPLGLQITNVEIVGLDEPSLQSRVHFAEYIVESKSEIGSEEIGSSIKSLLSASSIPWQHQRDTGCRSYDLRPLVDDIWVVNTEELSCTIGMRLLCSTKGAGRPEQVAKALGLLGRPTSIQRTKLILN
jgi:radical SAM-linked protein